MWRFVGHPAPSCKPGRCATLAYALDPVAVESLLTDQAPSSCGVPDPANAVILGSHTCHGRNQQLHLPSAVVAYTYLVASLCEKAHCFRHKTLFSMTAPKQGPRLRALHCGYGWSWGIIYGLPCFNWGMLTKSWVDANVLGRGNPSRVRMCSSP